jgi:hypothetical protein
LGVLQGLASFGLLGRLDYLSSRAGGSCIAGWLLAWSRVEGFQEVDRQLREAASSIQAPEVRTLRNSVLYSVSASGASAAGAILVRIRNIILNILPIGAVLAGILLFSEVGFRLMGHYVETHGSELIFLGALALYVISAIPVAKAARRSQQELFASPGLLSLFYAAVFSIVLASVLIGLMPYPRICAGAMSGAGRALGSL